MNLQLKKIEPNISIVKLFQNSAYLYNLKEKKIYKTEDFESKVWENSEITGSVIKNGEYAILIQNDNGTIFIDDTNGKILERENFLAFDIQILSEYEMDYIWGYMNTNYFDGKFYSDVGYFSSQEDRYIIVKKQYENEKILWVSSDKVFFLKNKEVEFVDYNLNIIWSLGFKELNVEKIIDCLEYKDRFILIAEKGKVIILNKESGKVLTIFSNELKGDFYNNYSISKEGKIKFLGEYLYFEYCLDKLNLIKKANFEDQNIFIRNSNLGDEGILFFSGVFEDKFPNLIGMFNSNTLSFIWKFVLETKNNGSAFYEAPRKINNNLVTIDRNNNFYIFDIIENN